MTFFVDISSSVLLKSFFRSFTRHAYIKTLKHTIELGSAARNFVLSVKTFLKAQSRKPDTSCYKNALR